MTKSRDRKYIVSAGGLLVQDIRGTRKIAIVRRTRYRGDIVLPKGKSQRGESILDTAIREVREETGFDVEIRKYAGSIRYRAAGTLKVVFYFHMRPSSEIASPNLDPDEVSDVEWHTPSEASKYLSYQPERDFLRAIFVLQGE